MQNNYKDYDTLTLYVKKNKLKEIIEYYRIFGWRLVKECNNKRYDDIVDLTFDRPHKIDNKDELQLQQVYMEENLNKLGKLDKTKHTCTRWFSLLCATITIILALVCIVLIIKSTSHSVIVFGMVAIAILFMILILETKLLISLYSHEKNIYDLKHNEIVTCLKLILDNIKSLKGGNYGQN